jgi:hypothetical protein
MVGTVIVVSAGQEDDSRTIKHADLKRMMGVPADAAHEHAITQGVLHLPSDQSRHMLTQL